ncbi:SEC-C domain-containing protein [Ilumatobacter sp.]|uniref:SEC-C domain-containing protein n=1 Tax=Ilumatobacter sp. TaxID=1967498 RepID=UPI0037512A96
MTSPDPEILDALPTVLTDRVVPIDDVLAALSSAGLDLGEHQGETLDRVTSMEGAFGDLAGGLMFLPRFFDGTKWTIEVTEQDLATRIIEDTMAIDPLVWWLVTNEVACVDDAGQVMGLLEVESFDDVHDSLVLPDSVAESLRPGWVSITLRDGAMHWSLSDGPATPTAAQIAAARAGFQATLDDPRNAEFSVAAGVSVPVGLERATDTSALLEAIAIDRSAFTDAAMPPVTTLFEAAGFEVRDRDVAMPGFDWDALATWRTSNIASLIFELTEAQTESYRTLTAALAQWRSNDTSNDASNDAMSDAAATADLFADAKVVEAFSAGAQPQMVALPGPMADTAAAHLGFVEALVAAGAVSDDITAFRVRCLDRVGRPLDAIAVLDEVTGSTEAKQLLLAAAEFAADRSDAVVAYALLQRAGALDHLASIKGEAETHTPDLELLFEIEPFAMTRPKALADRNDPCPCGSGKKFKKCHINDQPMHGLEYRAPWVHGKAMRFGRARNAALIETLAHAVCAHVDDGEIVEQMRFSPFIADVALHEGGDFARFLEARQELLPADEFELATQWAAIDRGVFEIVKLAGQRVELRNIVTDVHITVGEMESGSGIEAGDLMIGRPLPVGDGWRAFGGFMPCDPSIVENVVAAIAARDALGIAGLIGDQLAPTHDDLMSQLGLDGLGLDAFDGLDIDALGLDETDLADE